MQESDLYPALKSFLEKQGFEVKAEIENCDAVAIKPDQPPVIIELKLSLNLEVLLQAVDRVLLSPIIYVGVPHSIGALKYKKRKRVEKLMKMLGIGLLAINAKQKTVEIVVPPSAYTPRQSKPRQQWLIDEFVTRKGDPNLGGASTKTGRMTAYKQQAIEVAKYLHKTGTTKASDIAKTLDIPRARNILYDNHYGWFEGLGKGMYQLSKLGKQVLESVESG